jgi:thiosulfate/3-mercaptopyruvate sulfurtransferase
MAAVKNAAVVTTQWLKQQLSNTTRNLRVLDSSWSLKQSGHEDFLRKHIPGAGFFDLNNCLKPTQNIPRSLPDQRCFEEYAQLLGVKENQHLVIYDQGGLLAAARAWWQFRAYGHPNVSVLEGGLNKWEADGNPVSTGGILPEKNGQFKTRIQPHLMKSFEEIMEVINTKSSQILDARNPENYKGDEEEPSSATRIALETCHMKIPTNMAKGHIPGAINFPTSLIMDPDTGMFNTAEEIIENFRKMGVDLNKPITTLCYNGNAACVVALGAAFAGKTDTAVYYGSWTEFGQRVSQADCVLSSGQDRRSG